MLAAITGHVPQSLTRRAPDGGRNDKGSAVQIKNENVASRDEEDRSESSGEYSEDLIRFAADMEVSPAEVVAACAPQDDEPYMHLDHRTWEEMKKQTPSSGRNSISPIVPAATLLALWFKYKKLGSPTVKQAQAVLSTLGIKDDKPARGMKSREWLQLRDDKIVLNPARLSKALTFAKSFCSHNWEDK